MILVPNKDISIAISVDDGYEVLPKSELTLIKENSYDSIPTKVDFRQTDFLKLYDIKDVAKLAKKFDCSELKILGMLELFGYEDSDSGKSPIFFA